MKENTNNTKNVGRKPANIEWEKVEKMAMAGSNGQQISSSIGIHYDTLVKRCKKDMPDGISEISEYLRTKREKGNDLLHRKQFDLALKGDRSMLIWLGKQRLGQSEKKEMEVINKIDIDETKLSDQALEEINNLRNKEE